MSLMAVAWAKTINAMMFFLAQRLQDCAAVSDAELFCPPYAQGVQEKRQRKIRFRL
jgi:hypothetical protein